MDGWGDKEKYVFLWKVLKESPVYEKTPLEIDFTKWSPKCFPISTHHFPGSLIINSNYCDLLTFMQCVTHIYAK